MNLSIVLSTQPAQFQAATFKGDLEMNLAQIASLGYDGVELAIRDPKLVDLHYLDSLVSKYNLRVPAIGTGQAWGEEGLSFTDPDPRIRRAAIERIRNHLPVAAHFGAVIIIGLIRGIVKPGVAESQAMDWLVEALRECSDAAHRLSRRASAIVEGVPFIFTSPIQIAGIPVPGISISNRFSMSFSPTGIRDGFPVNSFPCQMHLRPHNRVSCFCARLCNNIHFRTDLSEIISFKFDQTTNRHFLERKHCQVLQDTIRMILAKL